MSNPGSNPVERRCLITNHSNATVARDYVSSLSGQIFRTNSSEVTTVHIEVRYVPDKLVMDANSLPVYLEALNSLTDEALESLAGIVLDDLSNELVPRWLHVTASIGDPANPVRHSVTFEDRQPNWENPVLLARITSI
jgi:7-cyano-7-deazaguanine reductase